MCGCGCVSVRRERERCDRVEDGYHDNTARTTHERVVGKRSGSKVESSRRRGETSVENCVMSRSTDRKWRSSEKRKSPNYRWRRAQHRPPYFSRKTSKVTKGRGSFLWTRVKVTPPRSSCQKSITAQISRQRSVFNRRIVHRNRSKSSHMEMVSDELRFASISTES